VTLQQTNSAATIHLCGINNTFSCSTKNDVSPVEERVCDVNDVRGVSIDRANVFGKPVKRDVQDRHITWPTYTFKLSRLKCEQCSRIWAQAITTTLNLKMGQHIR
jgi:hypothetical protein